MEHLLEAVATPLADSVVVGVGVRVANLTDTIERAVSCLTHYRTSQGERAWMKGITHPLLHQLECSAEKVGGGG